MILFRSRQADARPAAEAGTPARADEELPSRREPGVVHVTAGPVATGFVMDKARLAVVAVDDLTGRAGASTRDMRATPKRRRTSP